ncbi:MAG: PDZ domain-containing protein [Acidobacteriota bacterium]|nr:PDZ domain-containing protein [Acidobacteriota bacterium]
MRAKRLLLPLLLFVLARPALAAPPPVDYYVSLARAGEHLVHVRIHLAGTSGERDVQLPVWNALYQIRDFAQNVRRVTASNGAGQSLPVHKIDKTTWRIGGAESGAEVEYDILADQPGPYGAQLTSDHAFFNLAQILMYPVDARESPMTVTFTDFPSSWKIATALPSLRPGYTGSHAVFTARTYDRLVDGPVEIGTFRDVFFDQDGATFHVVVDADPADYDMDTLKQTVHKIVAAGVSWMGDRPFTEYLFIYHFPHGPGGGGMEHAYSTAIDVSADRLKDDFLFLEQVTAHEFFHLWNVKRIRPRALDPIDYTRENYTTSLWFCEGVTSTVANLLLLRAGLLDERRYLQLLNQEIRTLELRPAHLRQSVEESSLDTWFDKYPQYRVPERSISYYNKGEILGVLLDLTVRERTGGQKSLRDVLQWMNTHYANEGRPFEESTGVRQAAEAVTGSDFSAFFRDYVSGVEEPPYGPLLATVGLKLVRTRITVPHPGFISVKNFDAPPVVVSVEHLSEADRLGLAAGDTILAVDGKPASSEVEDLLSSMHLGDTLRLRVTGRKGARELKIRLGGHEEEQFAIVDADVVTPAQRARRAAWLESAASAQRRAAAGSFSAGDASQTAAQPFSSVGNTPH